MQNKYKELNLKGRGIDFTKYCRTTASPNLIIKKIRFKNFEAVLVTNSRHQWDKLPKRLVMLRKSFVIARSVLKRQHKLKQYRRAERIEV